MDFMMLRWDGSWCKYNHVVGIVDKGETILIYEGGEVLPYIESVDDIKEFGVITPFTKSYFEDNLRYQ